MFEAQAHPTPTAPPVETLDPADPGMAWRSVAKAIDTMFPGPSELEDALTVGFDRHVPAAPLTAAEVLAWVEQTPLSGESAGLLMDLDPAAFDDTGQVRLAAQLQRLENAAAGRKTAAVAAFAQTQEPSEPDPETGEPPGPDFTDCAVAVALGMSQPAAQRIVTAARRLVGFLPRTLAMMTAGDLGYYPALRVVEGAAELDAEQCAQLERLVLPKAPGKAPGKIAALVRKAVARIDAEALARGHRTARRNACLDITLDDGTDSGTGWVNGHGPVLEATVVRTAVEAWARAAKTAGDPRSLDELRWAALHDWSTRYLTGQLDGQHGHRPTSRGAPITVNIAVDLTTYLGLTTHPAEILGTGVLIPPTALHDLLPDAGLRRLITDPLTGHLLDASPHSYRPRVPLARFVTLRDVTSTGPNSSVPATEVDQDHTYPFDDGGLTIRANLGSPNRRWHNAKTKGGWTVTQNDDRTWTWTSPHGQTHTTEPHDYRLGP
jgi:hypothetical protein